MHRASHDDASYLVSLPGEPQAFCNGCHAPVATRASVGVDCVSCHGSPHTGDEKEHAKSDPAKSCGGCHEFDFPRRAPGGTSANANATIGADPANRMQRTMTEHAGSPARDRSCASCHMTRTAGPNGHVDHRFAASRDDAMLRQAIAAEARSPSLGVLTLDLRATAATGHAFPTGDMFRRLVVHADAIDTKGAILGSVDRVLAREFRMAGRPSAGETAGPRESSDHRLPASGDVVTLDLDLGEETARTTFAAIRWRVDYQRVTNGFRHPLEIRATVTVASGTLQGAELAPTTAGR